MNLKIEPILRIVSQSDLVLFEFLVHLIFLFEINHCEFSMKKIILNTELSGVYVALERLFLQCFYQTVKFKKEFL